MIEIYEISCDMSSMKIFFGTGSCFFSNNLGDGTYKVEIVLRKLVWSEPSDCEFIGHFTVLEKAYLMKYDCSIDDEDKLYTFEKGRYFVYFSQQEQRYYIVLEDDSTNA